MQFSTKQNKSVSPLEVIFNIRQIEVTTTVFLELTIDNNLSWDTNVNIVANKITSGIFSLYKMSKLCGLETLKIIYYAYIQ